MCPEVILEIRFHHLSQWNLSKIFIKGVSNWKKHRKGTQLSFIILRVHLSDDYPRKKMFSKRSECYFKGPFVDIQFCRLLKREFIYSGRRTTSKAFCVYRRAPKTEGMFACEIWSKSDLSKTDFSTKIQNLILKFCNAIKIEC